MSSDGATVSPKRDFEAIDSDVSTLLAIEGSLQSASSPEVHVNSKHLGKGKRKKGDILKAVQNLNLSSLANSPVLSDSSCGGSPDSNGTYSNLTGSGSLDELTSLTDQSFIPGAEKRLKRLLRNRLAAQESRQKKKLYVSDLESKVKFLEAENQKLLQRMLELSEHLNSGSIVEAVAPLESSSISPFSARVVARCKVTTSFTPIVSRIFGHGDTVLAIEGFPMAFRLRQIYPPTLQGKR
ncbi:Transcription factor hy5, partial [Massospora cicadina]